MARDPDPKALVIVFAKAPVPGEVKTRLIPALDAVKAAMLHTALTERAVETALAAGDDAELCCAPDAGHAFFQDCAEQFGIALSVQGSGDLGERMLRALERGLQAHGAVLVVGADVPAVSAAHLREAAAVLRDHDVALIPAEDGGYVLVGATRTNAAMFRDIDWGGAQVLEQQRAALAACGLTWRELDPLWDIDRPEDLARLSGLRPPLAFPL